ncbi:MAG: ATP-binding cassette domain-containing protein, partial [Neisseria sp.]|nr:ATP-binding cassette domain-containing protein [Neisseria sp.]
KKGEMIFIAGHSGSGKSTILKLISGITKPSKGKVWFNNQDLGELSDNQIGFMRQHIGIVFQDHKILYDRNVLQNVILPLRIIGYQPRKAEERARIAIEKVGLKGRELDDPVTLSGGEQQRLCIARAVVHQPSLLIADEPSANLDRAYALDIMELFKTFHEAGTTVIVAAHDETLMADYGHRILRLSKGRLA